MKRLTSMLAVLAASRSCSAPAARPLLLVAVAVAVAAALIAGCTLTTATAPLEPANAEERASTPVPAAGKAFIYVYRGSGDADLLIPIHMRGYVIGALPAMSYLRLEVAPGSHRIETILPSLHERFDIEAVAGDVKYIAWSALRLRFESRTTEQGAAAIRKSARRVVTMPPG